MRDVPAPGAQAGPVRCAVHPARPAAGACPVCGRGRCGACASAGERGCPGCRAPAARPQEPAVPPREAVVRGALAAYGAALLGGAVAAQYVDAEVFAVLTPAVVGAACGASAQAASRVLRGPERGRGAVSRAVRAVACVAAVLGVGLGFLLEGSRAPVSPGAVVPAALAVAGCLLWTAPPRRRPRGDEAA